MLLSLLFIVCVVFNGWLIWYCLSRPLRLGVKKLGVGLRRTRLYFAQPLTEIREQALRRRTSKLLLQLGVMILIFTAALVLYAPTIVFAHYRSGVGAAFYSLEALAGMLVAAVVVSWRGHRS